MVPEAGPPVLPVSLFLKAWTLDQVEGDGKRRDGNYHLAFSLFWIYYFFVIPSIAKNRIQDPSRRSG
jgi:hypothetical protein